MSKLSAKWCEKADDLIVDYPTSADARLLLTKLDNTFLRELEDRGYNLKTLKISIERNPDCDYWVIEKNNRFWNGKKSWLTKPDDAKKWENTVENQIEIDKIAGKINGNRVSLFKAKQKLGKNQLILKD